MEGNSVSLDERLNYLGELAEAFKQNLNASPTKAEEESFLERRVKELEEENRKLKLQFFDKLPKEEKVNFAGKLSDLSDLSEEIQRVIHILKEIVKSNSDVILKLDKENKRMKQYNSELMSELQDMREKYDELEIMFSEVHQKTDMVKTSEEVEYEDSLARKLGTDF